MSIDQQFVEFVIKSLVTKPEAVQVERRIDEKGVLLELTVDPEDLGRVIGKRGATAQSVRTLLRALGTKNDARYNLKIVDNGVEGSSNRSNNDSESTNRDDRAASAAAVEENWQTDKGSNDVDDVWATNPRSKQADDDETENDVVAQTRKELEDLDDLDV